MPDISIIELATLVRNTPERLLVQLQEAGVAVTDINQMITPEQKRQLLLHLQKNRGEEAAPKKRDKITLKRKSVGVVKQGKKSVSVEFRAKRTYVKPTQAKEQEVAAENQIESISEQEEVSSASETVHEKEPTVAPETVKPSVQETPSESVGKEEEAPRGKKKLKRETRERRNLREEVGVEEIEEEVDEPETAGQPQLRPFKRKKKPFKETRTRRVASLEQSFAKPTAPVVREVVIPESITVAELARKLTVKAAEVIKVMMRMGAMATINQILDKDTATLVVEEMGHKTKASQNNVEEDFILSDEQSDIEPINPCACSYYYGAC